MSARKIDSTGISFPLPSALRIGSLTRNRSLPNNMNTSDDLTLYKHADIHDEWIIYQGHLNYCSRQIEVFNMNRCKRTIVLSPSKCLKSNMSLSDSSYYRHCCPSKDSDERSERNDGNLSISGSNSETFQVLHIEWVSEVYLVTRRRLVFFSSSITRYWMANAKTPFNVIWKTSTWTCDRSHIGYERFLWNPGHSLSPRVTHQNLKEIKCPYFLFALIGKNERCTRIFGCRDNADREVRRQEISMVESCSSSDLELWI